MQRLYDLIEMVADTLATVMIEGENGTGKSMIARAIHHNSSRTDKPFVEVSCGALAETLLESELFGHRKGSFTGAIRDKVGKFEAADGGTIFLDEIGAASKSLQLKLLRVLQERRFEPVGGNRTVEVDVRVIAASNVDLLDEVNEGRFREDLYYRLNIMQIHVPPLRERVGDIRLLGKHFFDLYNERYRRGLSGIDKEALRVMERYGWPGNVRELENAMERAVIVCQDGVVRPHDLPRVMIDQREDVTLQHGVSLIGMLEDTEKELIRLALDRNNGRRNKTARDLRINRTTLFKKMKKYALFA
ncbi:Transcriptional regulatory protein ZraR [subsurface metagenome]